MVYVLLCGGVFFSVLTLYSPMEHSLGVNIVFPPLFPHVNAVFFLHSEKCKNRTGQNRTRTSCSSPEQEDIPCLPVLSTPLSYVCCVCMDRLMANFAGTCY